MAPRGRLHGQDGRVPRTGGAFGRRDRAERVIRRGGRLGLDAFAVRLRELWDAEDRFRADGIWGRKSVARLFRALPDHVLEQAKWHILDTIAAMVSVSIGAQFRLPQ